MSKEKNSTYFTRFELLLWSLSIFIIIGSALLIGSTNWLSLLASIIGATFLILNAKGNVWGQVLTVIFSLLYGVISYKTAYYGEMITYLGMTAPIAALSVISWLRNPAENGKNIVKINQLKSKEYIFLFILSLMITVLFYFILKAFHTDVLWLSTLSVFTSFIASYLTMRRSEYFALGYALNDVVLIVLWSIASFANQEYVALLICFTVFLINDIYVFVSWSKMKKTQLAT